MSKKVIVYLYEGKGLPKKESRKIADNFSEKQIAMALKGTEVIVYCSDGVAIIHKKLSTKTETLAQIGYLAHVEPDDEVQIWDLDRPLS